MSDLDPLGRADASEATRAANESLAGRLPFGDTRDFEEAERGLLAPLQDLVANGKASARRQRAGTPRPPELLDEFEFWFNIVTP
jgi:alkyl sulfatase BDS1-like metallo-beta-lactamase superfamily hydrolase